MWLPRRLLLSHLFLPLPPSTLRFSLLTYRVARRGEGEGGGLILESNHLSLMQHGWYRRRSDSGIIYRVFLQRRGAEPTVAMAGVSLFPRHTKWIPRSPRERTRLRRHLKYLEFFAADTIFFVLFSVRISVFLFFAWETMFARENAYNP